MLSTLYMPFLNDFLNEQSFIREKNLERQQEAIDKWHAAKKFPRKKKKQMRKEARYDYSFWVSMSKYHDAFFIN